MKELLRKIKSLPTTTSVQERNAQELQLLVDALTQKADELGFTVNLHFNTKSNNKEK